MAGSGALADNLDALYAKITAATNMVGFTGAGVSTASGVPDFRSPGSPWIKYPPVDYHGFMTSAEARREAWARKFKMDDIYKDAKSGVVHHVFAQWLENGKMRAIITQNIDALHSEACAQYNAPADKVIELHGNGKSARCLSCGLRYEIAAVRRGFEETGAAPVCVCGGFIKSATISFGERMPEAPMRQALVATQACDVFLCVGSSLVVKPAADFLRLAKQAGAYIAIINRTSTPLDGIADCLIHDEAEAVFAPYC